MCRFKYRRLVLVVLAGVALSLSSCPEYRIRIPDSDPTDTSYVSRTMHSFFWGLVMDPLVLSAECEDEGINDVSIRRSFAHDLASVLTLGIWSPLEVGFRCKAPDGSGSTTFPVPDSGSEPQGYGTDSPGPFLQ